MAGKVGMVLRFILLWLARASQRVTRTGSRAKTTPSVRWKKPAIIARERRRDFPATTRPLARALFADVLCHRQIQNARKIPCPIVLRQPEERSSFRAVVQPSVVSFGRAATQPMQWRRPWAARA